MNVPTQNSQSGALRLSPSQRIAILKALADPRRLELLERIAASTCPMGCAEARSALKIAPATLSHHIKELESAGLVHVEREGKFIFLSLRHEVWSALTDSLATIAAPHPVAP
jgi:ArsR family transcriptional regulator